MSFSRRPVLTLFLVAWVVRILAVFVIEYYLQNLASPPRRFVIEGDADGYWQLAHRIAAGDSYEIYTPPRQVLRMPGFPVLLAFSITLFGDSLLAARLLLATLGAIGCMGIYQLGKRLIDEQAGMVAGWMGALSPIFIGFSAIELTETAFATALIWGLVPLAGMVHRHSDASPFDWGRSAILTGLGAGLACYMRPSWLLFPPCLVLFLWVIHRSWKQFWWGALVIGAMWLSLLPWGIRNWRVTGHFTLTTFWMGPSLYDGWNSGNTTGDSDMTFFDRENLMGEMSEYEMDREYRRRAWEFARSHPSRVVSLAWKKSLRYWNPFPNAVQFQAIPGLSTTTVVWSLFVFVPAIIGVWLHRREWVTLAIILGPIFYFAALHIVFVSSVRYRLPAEYPLLVFSASGLIGVWKSLRRMTVTSSG